MRYTPPDPVVRRQKKLRQLAREERKQGKKMSSDDSRSASVPDSISPATSDDLRTGGCKDT